MIKSPTFLIILDGLGYSPQTKYNAVSQAEKPHYEYFFKNYPHTVLHASGDYVGLPENYIGNSEAGHITIGAGKRILQPITIINREIQNQTFFGNKILIDNLKKLKQNNGTLHIMGLFSDSGVHSHINHLFAFLKAAISQNISSIYIHTFLDGRDTLPKSARLYLSQLDSFISNYSNIHIGSIQGRFYAMDRNNNWERAQKSYICLTEPQKIVFNNWEEALKYYYANNITDEFIPPTQLDNNAIVRDNDGIIFFNTRPERARQLTECFVSENFTHFPVKKIKLSFFITPVSYGPQIKTNVLFAMQPVNDTLADILAKKHLTCFAIAESEKYAHITYYFRGGREEPVPTETQVLIPSMKAKDYINHPCMSANIITDTVIESLKKDPKDFYLINYANADMVGHSGNLEATIKAVECLDKQLGKLYDEVVNKLNGTIYITADHGNAEIKFDIASGQPSTSHTANPVPFLMLRSNLKGNTCVLPLTELADIKDFILKNLDMNNQ